MYVCSCGCSSLQVWESNAVNTICTVHKTNAHTPFILRAPRNKRNDTTTCTYMGSSNKSTKKDEIDKKQKQRTRCTYAFMYEYEIAITYSCVIPNRYRNSWGSEKMRSKGKNVNTFLNSRRECTNTNNWQRGKRITERKWTSEMNEWERSCVCAREKEGD